LQQTASSGSLGIASLRGALEKVEADRAQRTQHFLEVVTQRQRDLIAGLCEEQEQEADAVDNSPLGDGSNNDREPGQRK
jgi:hypothetical protein